MGHGHDILRLLAHEVITPHSDAILLDVRIGLRYTAVVVGSGADDRPPSCGLAATILPGHSFNDGCCCCSVPGPCMGKRIGEVLPMLDLDDHLHRTILLALCNAILCADIDERSMNERPGFSAVNREDRKNILIQRCEGKSVAMIGFFRPVARQLSGHVNSLGIMERNTFRHKEASTLGVLIETLGQLTAYETVIITATTLINDTFDDVLRQCTYARTIILMGPSTPLAPRFFRRQYPTVTALAGRTITDIEGTLRAVSQGGGTPELWQVTKKIDVVLEDRE